MTNCNEIASTESSSNVLECDDTHPKLIVPPRPPPIMIDHNHHQEQDHEILLKQIFFHELSSVTQREMHNIIYELGADIIPLLISTAAASSIHDEKSACNNNDNDNDSHENKSADGSKLDMIQQKQILNTIIDNMEIDFSKINHNHRLFHYLIHKLMKNHHNNDNINPSHEKDERLMVLKFLSKQSEHHPNKSLIAAYPGFLEALTSGVGFDNLMYQYDIHCNEEGELQHVANIICQLSKDVDNKITMARKVSIMETLLFNLQRYRNSQNQKSEKGLCLSIEALMHLSETVENKLHMVTYQQGKLLQAILILVEHTTNMSKTKSSSIGLQCIHNLICSETIEVLVSSPKHSTKLCQTLVGVVMMEFPFHDISTKAFKALQKLCLHLKKQHDAIIGKDSNHDLLKAVIQIVIKKPIFQCIDIDYISLELLLKLSKFHYHKSLIAQEEALIYVLNVSCTF